MIVSLKIIKMNQKGVGPIKHDFPEYHENGITGIVLAVFYLLAFFVKFYQN